MKFIITEEEQRAERHKQEMEELFNQARGIKQSQNNNENRHNFTEKNHIKNTEATSGFSSVFNSTVALSLGILLILVGLSQVQMSALFTGVTTIIGALVMKSASKRKRFGDKEFEFSSILEIVGIILLFSPIVLLDQSFWVENPLVLFPTIWTSIAYYLHFNKS